LGLTCSAGPENWRNIPPGKALQQEHFNAARGRLPSLG
jgi:hypothetical protein